MLQMKAFLSLIVSFVRSKITIYVKIDDVCLCALVQLDPRLFSACASSNFIGKVHKNDLFRFEDMIY